MMPKKCWYMTVALIPVLVIAHREVSPSLWRLREISIAVLKESQEDQQMDIHSFVGPDVAFQKNGKAVFYWHGSCRDSFDIEVLIPKYFPSILSSWGAVKNPSFGECGAP